MIKDTAARYVEHVFTLLFQAHKFEMAKRPFAFAAEFMPYLSL